MKRSFFILPLILSLITFSLSSLASHGTQGNAEEKEMLLKNEETSIDEFKKEEHGKSNKAFFIYILDEKVQLREVEEMTFPNKSLLCLMLKPASYKNIIEIAEGYKYETEKQFELLCRAKDKDDPASIDELKSVKDKIKFIERKDWENYNDIIKHKIAKHKVYVFFPKKDKEEKSISFYMPKTVGTYHLVGEVGEKNKSGERLNVVLVPSKNQDLLTHYSYSLKSHSKYVILPRIYWNSLSESENKKEELEENGTPDETQWGNEDKHKTFQIYIGGNSSQIREIEKIYPSYSKDSSKNIVVELKPLVHDHIKKVHSGYIQVPSNIISFLRRPKLDKDPCSMNEIKNLDEKIEFIENKEWSRDNDYQGRKSAYVFFPIVGGAIKDITPYLSDRHGSYQLVGEIGEKNKSGQRENLILSHFPKKKLVPHQEKDCTPEYLMLPRIFWNSCQEIEPN